MNRSFQPFPVLHTPRLLLRRLDPADAPAFFALRSDPAVNAYIVRAAPAAVADSEKRIAELRSYEDENKSITWAMVPKDGGELIGSICLWNADDERGSMELGFELMPAWWGKGLTSEAAVAVLQYAFDTIGVKEVQGWAHGDNTASRKLMEAQGFVRNTELEALQPALDRSDDTIIYCLSK